MLQNGASISPPYSSVCSSGSSSGEASLVLQRPPVWSRKERNKRSNAASNRFFSWRYNIWEASVFFK